MINLPLTAQNLADAVAHLCRQHSAFAAVVARHGQPSLRPMAGGMLGLLQIVTEQFLSLAAAHAIWQRVENLISPLTAEDIAGMGEAELLALGLSRAKVKSFQGIARAFAGGHISAESIVALLDDAARRALQALPGVGPWTAEVYLLAAELRQDAWPAGDLALQVAMADLFQLRERPNAKTMAALGEDFRPLRAVAARLLWSHYRGLKNLGQTP